MPSVRTTRRSAAAAAQQLEQEQSAAPPPAPSKKSGAKKSTATPSSSKKPAAAPSKPTKKAPAKKSRAKRGDPSPTPTPTPSPTPSPPPPPPAKNKKKGKAAEVAEKPTTSTAAATNNRKKKAEPKNRPIPDYLQAAPGRSRSCFADTSTNNKWNFGPALSCGRRKRDEMEFLEPKPENESGESRVHKNFKKGTIKFEMDVIHPFVMCRLCDGYLIDATTIIDCMHTFCKSCLLLYFEDDENTCPTCGILIHGSHPAQYVTFDRAINDLVMQLVPNLEADEKKNRRDFLNSFRDTDFEAEERAKQAAKEEERRRGTNRCYRGDDPDVSHHRDDNMVMVKLVPGCKDLPLTGRPFIRTSEMTTINTLKKYLALTLWDNQNKYSELDIFCDNQLMGKDFSIRFVWMMKRRQQPKHIPLELQYRNTIN